jgi:hypothetical protein
MKTWKIFCLFFLFLNSYSWALVASTNQQDEYQIFLKYNEKSPFIFMGKIDVNKASGNAGGMLYPGDNALVFFTAVLTHAAINSGVDHSRITKEQAEANKVFDDYQPYIQKFNTPENATISQLDVGFAKSKVSFLTEAALKADAEWEMDVAPIFFMTQNFGSLILYNRVILQENVVKDLKKSKKTASSSSAKKKANKNERIVVVISDPIAEPDYKHYWSNNDGSQFSNTLKNMYKESLSLVIANRIDNQKAENAEQITVKYMEDGVKKVERGYVISSNCKRTLFESLAGEIKSVPNLDFLNCPPSA